MSSVQAHATQTVEILLSKGANPNQQDVVQCTALHIACSFGFLDVVKLLVAHGASILSKDKRGRTPTKAAMDANHWDCVKWLQEYEKQQKFQRN